MRFLRKMQSITLLKCSRLLMAMGACTLCVLGLKSIISPEGSAINVSKSIAEEDLKGANELQQDAPQVVSNPDRARRRHTTDEKPFTLTPPLPASTQDDSAYPGWVDESQGKTTIDQPDLKGFIESNVRGDTIIRQSTGGAEVPPNMIIRKPGRRLFRTSRPSNQPFQSHTFPAQVDQTGRSGAVAPPVFNLPLQALPQQVLEPMDQAGKFAVGPGLQNLGPGVQIWPPNNGFQAATMATAPDPPRVVIREKLVHFDLKGAPPLVSYYKDIFPLLKKIGATGLLMEYEDMFPFTGRLKVANARNAYTKADIATILRLAKENGLYVIPLVQTFGHLEFVLKHPQFGHLREVEKFPQAVCPTRNGTFQLVEELIAQTLAMHPDAEYLHIGADEVFHLGMCPDCSKVISADPFGGKGTLFLSYIAQVLTHIQTKYPSIKPIMWDDMFHSMTSDSIKTGLGPLVNYVEPMIWSYFPNWVNHLPNMGDLYADLFPNLWGATAFKGSAGETLQIPNIKTQGMIHTSWIDALRLNGHKMKNFRGIVLTGWSRYDHFYPLCELFPVSIPSLAINMQILVDGEMNLPGMQLAAKNLNCQAEPSTQEFTNMDPNLDQFSNCNFPGIEVFRTVHSIININGLIKTFIEELEGKFPDYQSATGYLQPSRIDEQLAKISNYQLMLRSYLGQANSSFRIVFDQFTLSEWEAAYVAPLWDKMVLWKERFTNASRLENWPARPLSIPKLTISEILTVAPPGGLVGPILSAPSTPRNPFVPVSKAELAQGQLFF